MSNIHTCVFSKDRSLQLMALLESFSFYTDGIDETTIITPTPECYKEHTQKFPTVDWINEKDHGGFSIALGDYLDSLYDDDLVLFMVDDVVWIRPFNLNICEVLRNSKLNDVLGFSLRLGINIDHYDPSWNICNNRLFSIFDWRGKPLHFGYPFDVSCSVYKVGLVKCLFGSNKSSIRLPNDFEGLIVQQLYKSGVFNHLMMFNGFSNCIALDINRTQDLYKNPINGTEEHTVDKLNQLYKDGKRIVWENYANIIPNDFFYGCKDLIIK